MSHGNAALSFEGRRRLVRRCQRRPIAHVAAEAAVSRWREHGDEGLRDRSSRPHTSTTAPPRPSWTVSWRCARTSGQPPESTANSATRAPPSRSARSRGSCAATA